MSGLSGPIKQAVRTLGDAVDDVLDSTNQRVIWRHQLVGQKNPEAQNFMGEDPDGFYWKTQDHVVRVREQEMDEIGQKVFYGKFVPVVGDVLITVAGTPETDAEVKKARPIGAFRIKDVRVDRDDQKNVVATKMITVPDRTGQYGPS